jgi:hypothetical protein
MVPRRSMAIHANIHGIEKVFLKGARDTIFLHNFLPMNITHPQRMEKPTIPVSAIHSAYIE